MVCRADARTSRSSRSRPTKLESWTGRLFGQRVERAQGREARGKRGVGELEDLLGAGQVAEAQRAQCPQARPLGEGIGDELMGGARDERLAAVGDSAQPRAAVERRADVVSGVAKHRLAAVERRSAPEARSHRATPLSGVGAGVRARTTGPGRPPRRRRRRCRPRPAPVAADRRLRRPSARVARREPRSRPASRWGPPPKGARSPRCR